MNYLFYLTVANTTHYKTQILFSANFSFNCVWEMFLSKPLLQIEGNDGADTWADTWMHFIIHQASLECGIKVTKSWASCNIRVS